MTLVVAVAVRAVVHDFAVEDLLCADHLPEDNATVTAPAQQVALCCMLHLLTGEIAVGDDGTAEVRVAAESLLPYRVLVACTVVS